MQKRVIILVVLLCAGLTAARLVHRVTHEPHYNGRPLHYWITALGMLQHIDPNSQVEVLSHSRTGNVFRQLDTNALPYLLEWIQYEPSQWRYRLANHVIGLPPQAFFMPLAERIQPQRREVLAEGALIAFDFLGTKATPAIPDLARLMDNQAAPQSASRAAFALGAIGTNSVPALLKVSQNSNHPCQQDAKTALIRINHNIQPRDDVLWR
jgi:PBS lyase HEAT-like repeat-containing protein